MSRIQNKGLVGSLTIISLLVAMLGLFTLTLWYVSFSAGYVLCAVVIGAVVGFLMIVRAKTPSIYLFLLAIIILVWGKEVKGFFYNESGWMLYLQYFAIVFGVQLCLALLLRKRVDHTHLRNNGDA